MSDNYAKVKSRKYASDDDAENLLAGILDETEDVARAEQERIEAELRAKKDEERRRRESAEQAKKDEAAARLSAEMERLQKVEQRRTEKLEALKIEDLKERGEWIDPEVERRKLEAKIQEEAEIAAMKKAAEEAARRKHEVPAAAAAMGDSALPAPTQKSPNMAVMGGILVAVIAIVGGAAFVIMGGYQLDQATYSKAVFAPKEQQVAQVEKSFTPLPKPEPVVVADDDDDKGSSKGRSRSKSRTASKGTTKAKETGSPISSKPEQSKANARAKALEDALNTDVFGGGL